MDGANSEIEPLPVVSERETPGQLIWAMSLAVGALWIAAAALAAYRYIGFDRLAALDPVALALLVAVGVLPALMVLLAGAAAREGARARHEAKRLADAAAGLLNPAAHSESAARRLAVAVRGEISALDRAIEQTLTKLHEVEASVTKQTYAVNHVAAAAKRGADAMISGMEHERAELLRIAEDLNGQAALISHHIAGHTQSIAEAARFAEAEVRAADEALDARLNSFGAAAALITDRTQELTGAAAASADSALRLETALTSALETLSRATQLTDAARHSAEAAAQAANSTAGAMRDTTSRAIEEARRAADLIRGEAASVEREASQALSNLRDAAEQARGAARAARSAVEPPSEAPRQPMPLAVPAPPRRMSSFAKGPADVRAQAPAPPAQAPAPAPSVPNTGFGEPPRAPAGNGAADGAWTWRELLSSMDDDESAAAPAAGSPPRERARARTRDTIPDDPIARLTKTVTEQRGPHPVAAVALIAKGGVDLGEVFTASTLDRIAHRARNGSQGRRKAVRDAAGPAVDRVKALLSRDAAARTEAGAFLRSDGARIAELLSRGRASMSADATRAFLILDAAEG